MVGMADTQYQSYHHSKQPWNITGGFVVSVCIHALLLIQLNTIHLFDEPMPHQPALMEVEMVNMVTNHEVAQEIKQGKTESQPENPEQSKLKPVPKIEVPKPIKKKPVVTKKTMPKAKAVRTVKKVVHSVPKPVPAIKPAVAAQAQSNNEQNLQQMRQQYIARIMASIQAHKLYPYSARRRHIEGDIQVLFVIDAQGKVQKLHVAGSSSVLNVATKQAIEEALPFPRPQQQYVPVQFTMQYRLK